MRISDWSSDVCSSDLGLDFGVIFRKVHFGEIERLELFRREAAAIGLLGRAPSDPIEALELRTALFLDDAAKLGVEAAMSLGLLHADSKYLGRAIGAHFMAHARSPEHADFHVLLVAAGKRSEERRVGKGCLGTFKSSG